MNTPYLKTERLILRRFTKDDIMPIYDIYSDATTNTFLPWFPIKTLSELRGFILRAMSQNTAGSRAITTPSALRRITYP